MQFDNVNESLVAEFDKTIKSILKGIKIEDYIRMNWCPMELSIKYEKILSIKNEFYYNIDNKKSSEIIEEKPNNDIEQYINSIKEGAKKRGEIISDYELPLDPYEDYDEIPEELVSLLKE